MKRIMVDMSATLLHHGHVRLLAKASSYGRVIVALTTDEDILQVKGYQPELDFAARKEILEALRCVDEVVPSPWMLDQAFLDLHRIDLLVHGDDNANAIDPDRLVLFARTEGISSTELRQRACRALEQQNARRR
jgi:cytidyltransferase-like protein